MALKTRARRETRNSREGAAGVVYLTALATTWMSLPASVQAQDALSGIDTVIVTGTRATGRTVSSSEAPIDVLSSSDIEKTGKSHLLDVLNTLLPSFNLPSRSGNVSNMVRAGQLRGFDPGYTLVLINGKRWHSTSFLGAGGFGASTPVDLSLIPSSAIERIEVLRDGASAIYGSDAIAGVINIITKKDARGGGIYARAGQFYKGDGRNTLVQANTGFGLGERGHIHVSAQYDDQEVVIRDSPVPSTFLFYFPLDANGREILPAGNLSSDPRLPEGATPNPKEATRNNWAWTFGGQGAYELGAVTVDASAGIGEAVDAYGFFSYAHRRARSPQQFRHPSRDEVVRAIFPDGYTPWQGTSEDDFGAVIGLRGDTANGWNWDVSTNYGGDTIDVYVYNSLNPTYGLESQTNFYIGQWQYAAWTNNFDLRKSFRVGFLDSPVEFSTGIEYRYEDFSLSKGDVQSYTHGGQPVLDGPNAGKPLGNSLGGSQSLPGYRPEDEVELTRNSKAVYAGVSFAATRNWRFDLAGRYETFSDFGSTVTGRLSSRYDFTDRFALRGTVNNGFHAPSLAAQAYKNTANANTSINHTLQVNSPQARQLGSKPLEPEKSLNVTVGAVFEPFDGVNVAIDFYQIDVEGQIARSTTFREGLYPGSGSLVVAAGFGPQDGISYFINAADTRSRGVEATIEGRWDLGYAGLLRWSLAANYNKMEITDVADTPEVLAAFNIPLFSVGSQTNLIYSAPRSRQVLGLNWRRGAFTAQVRESHYGSIKRSGTPTTGAEIFYDVGGLWITDLSLDFAVNSRFHITAAANNLFDEKSDFLPRELLAARQSYARANNGPISDTGGSYSLSASWSF
jgi:iron complex outermembrane receptor protein